MSRVTQKTALVAAILLCTQTMADDIQQVQHEVGTSCDSCNAAPGQYSMRSQGIFRDPPSLGAYNPLGILHGPSSHGPSGGGWAPPQTRPLTRTASGYTTYNNYGMGGPFVPAPMIYQPTDTTQMGYSYTNVPRWQPNPNMIPPVPRPSQYHNRPCLVPNGGCRSAGNGYYSGGQSSCPSCQVGSVQQSVPHQQYVARPTVQPVRQFSVSAQTTVPSSPAAPQLKQISEQKTLKPASNL